MMKLSKLHVDSYLFQDFETMAIREGFINKYIDEVGEGVFSSMYIDKHRAKRLVNKSKLLAHICLFGEIESYRSAFDLSRIAETGLISSVGEINNPNVDLAYNTATSEEKTVARGLAIQFLTDSSNKKKIVRATLSDTELEIIMHKSKEYVSKAYDYAMHHLIHGSYPDSDDFYGNIDLYSVAFNEMEISVAGHLKSLEYGLHQSLVNETPLLTGVNYMISDDLVKADELIEDFYYLARTKLSDEIKYLPSPRSLKEAIKIRNRPELITFREVLEHWLFALKDGDEVAEETIRKDIFKANRELKRLESWREFKDSPLNFWINSIGGHIPILSNVLTAFTTIAGLYEMRNQKKHNWITMINSK